MGPNIFHCAVLILSIATFLHIYGACAVGIDQVNNDYKEKCKIGCVLSIQMDKTGMVVPFICFK